MNCLSDVLALTLLNAAFLCIVTSRVSPDHEHQPKQQNAITEATVYQTEATIKARIRLYVILSTANTLMGLEM